ncbi:MAG: cardiolipin synthase [Akkermansiaceae bacterium]
MKNRRRRLIGVFVIFAHVLGAITSVNAVMQTRTSQGAIAWAISLNTMPYVAVPAYWVFGRTDFNGYITARRTHRVELKAFWDDFEAKIREEGLVVDPKRNKPMVTEILSMLPATVGNDAELLIDGEETYQSIFEGISKAEDYLLVQFYIIRNDTVGIELRDRLVERAKAGVRCYLLYDEIGSQLPESFKNPLLDAGVEVLPFNTTQGDTNRFQLNFRNHRKIVIVDGKESWIGGLNVGEEYKGLDPNFGNWRDTHMRVAGPVVQCVQVSFIEDWHWAGKKSIDDLNWNPKRAENGVSKAVACIPTGPVDEYETATLFFLNAIHSAEQRLWIASPYFVPDQQFISALQLAALKGVDVRIIVPDTNDSELVNLSSWTYVPDLQKVGIKVYRYEKGFMHQKVMVIDDQYCTIGTANFDNRSFRLNFEITIGLRDVEFTTEVAEMLEADMSNSRLVKKGEYEAKSSWFRFWSKLSKLTAPIQ